MRQVKRLLDEPSGIRVEFYCPDPSCGADIADHVEDATYDWTQESAAEGIGQALSLLSCEHCGTAYSVEVVALGSEKRIKIVDHPDTPVRFSDDSHSSAVVDFDYDDYLASFDPKDPDDVFNQSFYDIERLLDTVHTSVSRDSLLRMLYLQCVVALEAYLSDRILSVVMEDHTKLVALIGAMPGLRDKQVKFIEVATKNTFGADATKAYLQAFSFHDLERVDKMYRAVLGTSLFADEKTATDALEMVKTRHDLVHRNGRDSSGNYTTVSDNDVRRAKGLINSIFERVEKAYNTYAGYDDFPF